LLAIIVQTILPSSLSPSLFAFLRKLRAWSAIHTSSEELDVDNARHFFVYAGIAIAGIAVVSDHQALVV
jgi:hypothetical protein